MNKTNLLIASATLLAGTQLFGALGAAAASVDKSIDVAVPADKVWAMIGPFCSIKDWHPAIGQCTSQGDERTLTLKDGKTQFVEQQTARDDKGMMYSYAIEKSPLPISDYKSTLKVTPKGANAATVEWSSTYTPAEGKDADAATAIGGIYQAGLDNIKTLAK